MQFITISEQLKNILFAFIFGCNIGIGYDIIYLIRLLIDKKQANRVIRSFYEVVFVHIFDLIYLILVSISYCIFVYHFNAGRFRLYLLSSLVFGLLLYNVTLCKVIRLIFEKIAIAIKALVNYSVVVPLLFILDCCYKIILPVIILLKYISRIWKTKKAKRVLINNLYVN